MKGARAALAVVLILHGAFADILDEKCQTLPDGKMTPHPDNCEYFVECYGGYPYVRKCGAGLYFNLNKDVCDYPHLSNCGQGHPQTQYNNNPFTQFNPSRRPQSTPVHRPRRPANNEIHLRGAGGRGRQDDTTYEETVYGMVTPGVSGREFEREVRRPNHRGNTRVHVGYAPPVERPVSSFPGGHRPLSGRRMWWRAGRRIARARWLDYPPSRKLPGTPPYLPLADEKRKLLGGDGKLRELGLGGRSQKLGPVVKRHTPGNVTYGGSTSTSYSISRGGRARELNTYGGRRSAYFPHVKPNPTLMPPNIPSPTTTISLIVHKNHTLPIKDIISRILSFSNRKLTPGKHLSQTPRANHVVAYRRSHVMLSPQKRALRRRLRPFRKLVRAQTTGHKRRPIHQILGPFRQSPRYTLKRLHPIDPSPREGGHGDGALPTNHRTMRSKDYHLHTIPIQLVRPNGRNKIMYASSIASPIIISHIPGRIFNQRSRTYPGKQLLGQTLKNRVYTSHNIANYNIIPRKQSRTQFRVSWPELANSTLIEVSNFSTGSIRSQDNTIHVKPQSTIYLNRPLFSHNKKQSYGSDIGNIPGRQLFPYDSYVESIPVASIPLSISLPISRLSGGYHKSNKSGAGISELLMSEMKAYTVVVMEDAKHQVRERLNREMYIAQQMSSIMDSRPYSYVSHFLDAKPYAKALSKCGMAINTCLKLMSKRFHSPGSEILSMAGDMGLDGGLLKQLPGTYQPDTRFPMPPDIDYCPYPEDYACDIGSPYRTADGTCNNLNRPILGRAMTPFRRLKTANYADGVEDARISANGGPLPSARRVSLNLFPDVDKPAAHTTMFFVFWGQFTDHDLTLTAITEAQTDDGPLGETEPLRCGFDGCQEGQAGLEACWPIPVPEDDPDFPYNRCIKFVRSAEVPQLDCRLGHREQLNQATHWLDASMVYGNNKEDQNKLRDFSDRARGPMKISEHPVNRQSRGKRWKPLLPHGEDPFCRNTNESIQCFAGGDERVNENAALCTCHTMMVREHNRVEQQLHFLNPHWEGEQLYQETKRIVNACSQHVVFHEFLPLALGPDLVRKHELQLQDTGFYYGYDARVDPRIPNEFAAAAFRFGHTLLQEKLHRADEFYNVDDSLFLSSALNRPEFMYKERGIDDLVRGLSTEKSQNFDQFFTKQISRHLFTEDPPHTPSMDLISLNIMRGRDHGLPTYNQFREWCGLKKAYGFDDLAPEIPDSRARKALSSVYRHVDDIDVFAGGVSERSVRGGMVGPTFGCIISEAFKNLRQGDRFWYENDGIFTSEQLQELRKITLAKMMCRNSDGVAKLQPWLMLQPTMSPNRDGYETAYQYASDPDQILQNAPDGLKKDDHYNPLIPCKDLPDIDLTKWAQGPFTVHK